MLVAGATVQSPFQVFTLEVVLRNTSIIRKFRGGKSKFFSIHRTSNPCRRI